MNFSLQPNGKCDILIPSVHWWKYISVVFQFPIHIICRRFVSTATLQYTRCKNTRKSLIQFCQKWFHIPHPHYPLNFSQSRWKQMARYKHTRVPVFGAKITRHQFLGVTSPTWCQQAAEQSHSGSFWEILTILGCSKITRHPCLPVLGSGCFVAAADFFFWEGMENTRDLQFNIRLCLTKRPMAFSMQWETTQWLRFSSHLPFLVILLRWWVKQSIIFLLCKITCGCWYFSPIWPHRQTVTHLFQQHFWLSEWNVYFAEWNWKKKIHIWIPLSFFASSWNALSNNPINPSPATIILLPAHSNKLPVTGKVMLKEHAVHFSFLTVQTEGGKWNFCRHALVVVRKTQVVPCVMATWVGFRRAWFYCDCAKPINNQHVFTHHYHRLIPQSVAVTFGHVAESTSSKCFNIIIFTWHPILSHNEINKTKSWWIFFSAICHVTESTSSKCSTSSTFWLIQSLLWMKATLNQVGETGLISKLSCSWLISWFMGQDCCFSLAAVILCQNFCQQFWQKQWFLLLFPTLTENILWQAKICSQQYCLPLR